MFTVISNVRNSNLYLIAALTAIAVILFASVITPAASAPESPPILVTGRSETASDYYQRHPELRLPAANGDNLQSDFFQRHPELSATMGISVDTGDYFLRHPEWRPAAPSTDLSDYFLRH